MENKKRKRKSKKRRLLITILMLMLTGLMTVTSTYAWFTANKTVTVNTINVNVAAANGLQLSVDGVEWKPVITNEDIIATITGDNENYPDNVNQLPNELTSLAPVSSAKTVDANGHMEMFLGSIDADEAGNYSLTATKDEETKSQGGHFVVFDLFFQVQAETTVYLTDASKVSAGTKDTGIQNAARAAFVIGGNTPAGSATTTIQELKGTEAKLWEPNYDVHTPSGVSNAKSVYELETTTTGASQLTYYGVKAAITTGVKLNSQDTQYFTQITPDILTTKAGIDSGAYQEAFTLQPGVSKVRVYLWVEGQDVDCESIASGGQIAFDLQFSSLESVSG